MNRFLVFILGFILGGSCGIALAALMQISKTSDETWEDMFKA